MAGAVVNQRPAVVPRRRAISAGRRLPSAQLGGRSAWFALAAALVVLAATVVAWGLARAADRTAVVGLARPIAAGEVFAPDHLAVRQVAVDGGVAGLVPAASIGALVGRSAAVDLAAGTLLSGGLWADTADLAPDERSVGMVLRAGRFPDGLVLERMALVLDLTDVYEPMPARVLAIDVSPQRETVVTVAVAVDIAATVARLAAADAVAVIGVPFGVTLGAGPDTAAGTAGAP